MDTRDVFVIHGRDERLRVGMFNFLKSLDLHPDGVGIRREAYQQNQSLRG